MTKLSPFGNIFPRSSFVGFDQLFSDLEHLAERQEATYPPHNIIRTGDNEYVIELAIAGYNRDSINIDVVDRSLTIIGDMSDYKRDDVEYEHRGISARKFNRTFRLSEHVEVIGADLENGILSVFLERIVPDEKKPRSIEINYKSSQPELLTEEESLVL